jgi:hypothetical protein
VPGPVQPAVERIPRDRTLFSMSCAPRALPISRLMSPHRALLGYWEARRGKRAAPRRADIDPADFQRVLPHVMIWDVGSAGDYRCRLAGTEIDAAMAGSLNGIRLGDVPCSLIDEAQREFDAVRDGAMASFAERTMAWRGRPFIFYRHLLLPIANEAGGIHQLISVLTFHSVADLPCPGSA